MYKESTKDHFLNCNKIGNGIIFQPRQRCTCKAFIPTKAERKLLLNTK